MTVHTMRQITALQRASQRWQHPHVDVTQQITRRPTVVLNTVRAVEPPTPTLIDRINHAVARLEESRITWAILGVAFVVGYVWIMAQVITVYTGVAP